MEEQFDVIVIGGGLSGIAAAYTLAEAGKEVILIEKGDYCGAKNVTGGRMYVAPIRDLFPKLWDKAPLERGISHEEICLMTEESSVLIRYDGKELSEEPYQSYSVCRAKFDKYFAKQAERKGAVVVTKTKVENLIFDDVGNVSGVVAGGDELRANVVICCDGVLSIFPQQAGLQKAADPKHFAVGFKEIIEMDQQVLQDRFNLTENDGVARLYMGDVTLGKFGGAFLYTNKNSISLGLVVGIEALMKDEPKINAPDLLERFKQRPEVANLIAGGTTVEYSAHVVPEGGYKHLSKLYGDGILVAGDSAGFSINTGITVRGMEYAMASGYFAAQAVIAAGEKNDYSSSSLSVYQQMLENSFLMKDFQEFKNVTDSLNHHRFFTYYPSLVCDILRDLYHMPNGAKDRIYPTVRKYVGFGDIFSIVTKDFPKVVKL